MQKPKGGEGKMNLHASVRKYPGSMTTADIPRGRHSWYNDSVKPVTAHFVVDFARKHTNKLA